MLLHKKLFLVLFSPFWPFLVIYSCVLFFFQESYDEEDEDVEEEEELEKLAFDSPHPWLDVVKGFSWSRYLECTNSRSAPAKLFSEAFPIATNNFKVGQKLEAIGPIHILRNHF